MVLLHAMVSVMWIWPIISWCMCFYVVFASSEGVRWFSVRHNPYLISLAVGGALVWLQGVDAPRPASVALSAAAWSCYAVLVSQQSWRYRLWRRHIVPVNVPLLALVLWCIVIR